MMHKERRWCVAMVQTAEELADKLANYSWCGCCGFELRGCLWLNDSTGPNNAQEWAAVLRPTADDHCFRQIESITASWCNERQLLAYIQSIYGDGPTPTLSQGPVVYARSGKDLAAALGIEHRAEGIVVCPTIETPEEHGHCHLCA